MPWRSTSAALALRVMLAVACVPNVSRAQTDLSVRYPGTPELLAQLDRPFAERPGLVCTASFRTNSILSGFSFKHADDLDLFIGPCRVIFGVCDDAAVWAVVTPLEGKDAFVTCRASGAAERVSSVFVRFAPDEVATHFPSATVSEPAPPLDDYTLRLANRTAAVKTNASWQRGGQPVLPDRGSLILDCETIDAAGQPGLRRFFSIDKGKLTYVAAFEQRRLQVGQPISREDCGKVFDQMWETFDDEYAMFGLLPEATWDRAWFDRDKAVRSRDTLELAFVLSDTVAKLEDLHAGVMLGDEWMPGYTRDRPVNGPGRPPADLIPSQQSSPGVLIGRTADGIGYANIPQLTGEKLPENFDAALERLADTWALVVDLRYNGGGDELLGRAIAGRFLDQERVYSRNRFRAGAGSKELSEPLDRACPTRGPWRYGAPVILLQGRRTMSSAESTALMFAQCPQVTTMGDTTAGSSGRPRRFSPGAGITVQMPTWIDYLPDGQPLEHRGIAPEIAVEAPPAEIAAGKDPVLAAALAKLRETPEAERRPAKEPAAGEPTPKVQPAQQSAPKTPTEPK